MRNLDEIMRLIEQALFNIPEDAPEREETMRAWGALHSHLGYKAPAKIIVIKPDGYTTVKYK